jgi:hypothetical protein
MGKRNDSGRSGRRVDDVAMGVFLQALRRGAVLDDAARAAGFSVSSFLRQRKRDPAFAEAWEEAIEISSAPRFIAPGNGRKWQLKKTRRLRFEGWRKEVFLAHFAASCDLRSAAEAAGVHEVTVNRHRNKDAEFDAACERALQIGYAKLEAEALRQRLEAQQKLRGEIVPSAETAMEFERVLKLLERWDKRRGRAARNGRAKDWSFEEALSEIDRSLRALGLRRGIAPPDEAEARDPEDDEGEGDEDGDGEA